ncbi:MAG: prefoldin subunit beta [Candidatus Thorarchaeota archaeon]
MSEEVPPRVRQQLVRVQQTRDSLQYVTALLLQVKQQLAETNSALEQLKGMTPKNVLYQASGPLLFKTTKPKATKNLKAQVEALEVRIKSLEKQETQLRKQYDTLQETLRGMLGQPGTAPAG